jgi:CubicO group peptidase (beta-lactamase class C family)
LASFGFRGANRWCIIRPLKGRDRWGKLDSKIDAVFADMNMPQHPGAALLVIDHDEIVYNKCYALADLETQRPFTSDTSFYQASISKQFTAMAIMLLAEDGRLSYEDRLPAYRAWLFERRGSVRALGLPDADSRRRRSFLHTR